MRIEYLKPGDFVRVAEFGTKDCGPDGWWLVVTGKPEVDWVEATLILGPEVAGLFRTGEATTLDTSQNDVGEFVPLDEVPDHVWQAFGEIMLCGG